MWIKTALAFMKSYWLWIVGAAVLGGLIYIASYIQDAEQAKARVTVLEEQVGTARQLARDNAAAVIACKEVNLENARAAEAARNAMTLAREEIRLLRAAADNQVEIIRRESETFNTGLGCPAMDRDFRVWLLNDA